MQQKRKVLSVMLAAALAIAAVPTVSAFAQADLQLPVVSSVAASPNPAQVGDLVTVTANVNDALTGGSNIQSAEFSVNGGTYAALAAVDGAFDSPTEAVTGTFTTNEVGDVQICVKGTDAAGLVSTPVCADFSTESQIVFEGFFPPIEKNNKFLRAGRTIPVKFTLSMPDGSPITDPAVFGGIFSYEVDCQSQVGDVATAVQEVGPGKAAVRVTPDGEWIALWKTPSSYAGSCRLMYVAFSDGSTSPEVVFRFR